MLPGSLYSSYEQYKLDSNFVVNWLATNVIRCGYIDEDTSTAAPKTGRLKGKARKEARNAGMEETCRVKIKDFVPLAQCIADCIKPRVEVPASLAYRLRSSIKQRKYHHEWHSRQIEEYGDCCRDGHGYFIGILEQVEEVLRPNLAPGVRPDGTARKEDSTDISFANKFEKLTVEEPSEALDHGSIQDPPRVTNTIQYKSDLDTSRDEAFFAIDCLFRDVHRARKLVQDLWESYYRGRLDLVAVSISTNTAIDFVRNLQEDFEATFGSAYRHQLDRHLCFTCAQQSHAKSTHANDSPFYDHCLISARAIVSDLAGDLPVDAFDYVPIVEPEYMELYDQGGDRAMNAYEQVQEQYKLAMGVIPEYQVLILRSPQVEAEHEIMRGLRQAMEQKEPIFWLSFALQVFLDIRHILREDVTLAFADLREGADAIIGDAQRALCFYKKAGVQINAEKLLEHLIDLVSGYTRTDKVGAERRALHADPTTADPFPEFYLLQRDPLWCGLLLYSFRVLAYEYAIATANSWPAIMASAHLYNSFQQERILSHQWDDMEHVFSTQEIANLFVGDLPKSLMGYAKRYALALGVSSVSLAEEPTQLSRHQDESPQSKEA